MTDLQKFMYNPVFFDRVCPILNECIDHFDCRDFIFRVFNNKWPDMEWRDRTRHIAKVLHHFLSKDFSNASRQLVDIIDALRVVTKEHDGSEYAFLARYVELYGQKNPEESMKAMEKIAELAGREFDWYLSPMENGVV